jgi:hypothetical protein
MQMRAARSGLRVLELPVPYRRRSGGQSKIAGNFFGSVKAAARIVATFVRVAMEWQRPLFRELVEKAVHPPGHAMYGWRPRCKRKLTVQRIVRVRSCFPTYFRMEDQPAL